MAEIQIKDLGNAGTPATTMHFAVQQEAAVDIAQEIALSEFSEAAEMTVVEGVNKLVTPNAFTKTYAKEDRYGTVEIATVAEIAGQSSTEDAVALPVGRIPEIFRSGIPLTTAISGSDIDGATEGVLSSLAIYESIYGNRAIIGGTFTLNPSQSTEEIEIYINNITQPMYTQSGSGYLTSASATGELHSLAIKIESVGTPTSGGGQIRLTIGRGNVTFNSSGTYYIGLNIDYSAKI